MHERGGRASSSLVRWLRWPAAMPPQERFVPRFAAEPPQEELPYGRWEERLRQEFLAAALRLDAEEEDLGEPSGIVWYPDRTWHGRTYVPGDHADLNRIRAVRLRALPRGQRRRRAERLLRARGLHRRDSRAKPRLEARPLRGDHRRLAGGVGSGGGDDARVGAPARLRRDGSQPPSWPTSRSTNAS